jgi:16S rRNA (guanine527-N7)-methyltransferase
MIPQPAKEYDPADFLPERYPIVHFPDDAWKTFCGQCAELSIPDADAHRETLEKLYSHLLGVNEWLNLTRITAPAEYLKFQLLDSLSVLPIIAPMLDSTSMVADLGSGGGYPGLPLMTWLTTQEFYLIDAKRKKVEFLNASIPLIPRHGKAAAFSCRGREIGQLRPDLEHKGSIVTARAVGRGVELLADASALLATGGVFVLLKGPSWPQTEGEEFERICPYFGFEQVDDVVLRLTPEDPEHHIILALKKERLDPRKAKKAKI